jgi:hypothetical protein
MIKVDKCQNVCYIIHNINTSHSIYGWSTSIWRCCMSSKEVETQGKTLVTAQQGQKFYVDIEGKEYPWDHETITVQQLRELGNLPADTPVIEVDPDNNERTLTEDEVIQLKPGHRYGKKARYKRG